MELTTFASFRMNNVDKVGLQSEVDVQLLHDICHDLAPRSENGVCSYPKI